MNHLVADDSGSEKSKIPRDDASVDRVLQKISKGDILTDDEPDIFIEEIFNCIIAVLFTVRI